MNLFEHRLLIARALNYQSLYSGASEAADLIRQALEWDGITAAEKEEFHALVGQSVSLLRHTCKPHPYMLSLLAQIPFVLVSKLPGFVLVDPRRLIFHADFEHADLIVNQR